MNSAVSPQQLHANLMIAIDTVDSTALTGIIRALRVIIEARKGELDTAEAELQGRGERGNFREIASNRPRKRSAFGNCTKIGGMWPDKYLNRLPNRESAALAKFLDSPPPWDQRATSRNQYWPVTTPGLPPIDRMPGVEREAIAADSLIEAASPCLHSVFTGDMARDPFPDKPDRAREKKCNGSCAAACLWMAHIVPRSLLVVVTPMGGAVHGRRGQRCFGPIEAISAAPSAVSAHRSPRASSFARKKTKMIFE